LQLRDHKFGVFLHAINHNELPSHTDLRNFVADLFVKRTPSSYRIGAEGEVTCLRRWRITSTGLHHVICWQGDKRRAREKMWHVVTWKFNITDEFVTSITKVWCSETNAA